MRVYSETKDRIEQRSFWTLFFLLSTSLLLFLSLGHHAKAEESQHVPQRSPFQTITLAAEDSWSPFANQFGQGISHQLIEAAFKQTHIEVNSLVVPYSRALMMAEKGAVDGVFNVTREASTEQRFIFGETPLFAAKASFYQRKKRSLIAENKWQIPKGSMIGVIKSYEYGDEFPELVKQRQLNLVTVATQQQLINLLLIGRIDAAVMFDLVAQENLQTMGVSDEVFAAFDNHISLIYLAFSKENPKATLLAKALDQGLSMLKENGQYQQLLKVN